MQVCCKLFFVILIITAAPAFVRGAVTVDFSAGTPAGWDFHEIDSDIARNNTVDWDDLAVIAAHWLNSGCDGTNQWCVGADIDSSSGVDLIDYAILTGDWAKTGAQNVLLQTIYGTAQDSAGNITANLSRAVSKDKGLAMAFNVPTNTTLNKMIFKCYGNGGTWRPAEPLHIRMFNVTGKGYLNYNHSGITKADPGSGGALVVDCTAITPNPIPSDFYHFELGDGRQYTDLIVNFGPLEVTAGDYFITLDATTGSSTWGSFVRSNSAAISDNMGKYPDGTPLPKRATVTINGATGSTYYYQLEANTSTSYTPYSYLYAFQITTAVINNAPQVNAGPDQIIVYPDTDVTLDGTVTDDGIPNPPGVLTTTWSKISGPGDVAFGDASAVDTTATFSVFGTYILRLTANDGDKSSFDEINIGPCSASNSNPANGATGVSRTVLLTWSPCAGTVRNDVYFGTNSSVVSNGTTPIYTTSGNSYSPGTLEYLRTYYWRIDEFDGTSTSKGSVWSFTTVSAAPAPAFPTAEGAGKWSIGGRGGTVYEVTTLQDYDSRSEPVIPGSLRAATEASGARIVVFRISGTIHLKYKLKISNSHITIAGQTAPGDGICIARYPVSIETDHVIIRYVRFRLSDNAADEGDAAYDGPEGYDCLSIDRGHNIIIDHCSTSWSIDELLSCGVVGASTPVEDHPGKLTVQWCIIGESLDCSVHNSPACHGYGTLAKAGYGNELTYHHNLYMHNRSRNPYPGNYNDISNDPAGLTFDFRNNVIYNWMNEYAGYNTQGQGANSLTKMNFVGNYYKHGTNSTDSKAFFERVLASRGYFSGNWMDTGYPADPWSLVIFDSTWNASQIAAFKLSSPFTLSDSVTTDDALTAYSEVLSDVGAVRPARDAVDNRLVSDVINGTGHIINDETDVGGWPTLNSTTPPVDSDHDGMPDSWETARGLNPNNVADGAFDRDSDGYTNIEEYINSL